jgi:tRNA 2-thiouridine synthesizing protein D
MRFAILIHEGPYNHEAPDTAYNFTLAALHKGHTIERIFFYHDGVINASSLAEPPQDDRNIQKRWSDLGVEHGIDIVACIAASKRRGIKDGYIMKGTRISGLGQLTEMTISADRLVTFG